MYKMIFSIRFALAIFLSSTIHFPFLIIRPFNYKNTALYLSLLKFFCGILLPIKFKRTGYNYETNHTPSIMISNHQSSFDMIWAAYCMQNNIVSLGKFEILYLPIFGLSFLLSGNILIKRGNKQSRIKAMKKIKAKLLKENISIIIFPEGHRNQDKKLLDFKSGAFILAKEMSLPIIPFAVQRYAKKIGQEKIFTLDILEPISRDTVRKLEVKELKEVCYELIQKRVDSL